MPQEIPIEMLPKLWSVDSGFGKVELTSRRYRQLAKEGKVPSPVNGKVNILEALKALIAYYQRLAQDKESPTLTDERARFVKAQANRAELKLQKERGEVIPTELAIKEWGKVIHNIRQKLLVMPTKLSPLIYGEESIPAIKNKIQAHIYDILYELSNSKKIKTKKVKKRKVDKNA